MRRSIYTALLGVIWVLALAVLVRGLDQLFFGRPDMLTGLRALCRRLLGRACKPSLGRGDSRNLDGLSVARVCAESAARTPPTAH